MRNLMDTIIKKKLQEMDENELGTEKDILDVLALSHKMSMDHLDKQIKLEELKEKTAKNQVNVQINNGDNSSNYEKLLAKIMW